MAQPAAANQETSMASTSLPFCTFSAIQDHCFTYLPLFKTLWCDNAASNVWLAAFPCSPLCLDNGSMTACIVRICFCLAMLYLQTKISFMRNFYMLLFLCLVPLLCSAQVKSNRAAEILKNGAGKNIEDLQQRYSDIALQIWDYAEVGYKEEKSSLLLQSTLKENGFTVHSGVAGIPTAFVGTFGSGKPVIGILAEYDALPGLSQEAAPERKPLEGKSTGHGCGHHLFGTASVAAGIELKKLLETKNLSGTVKVFGTPAEEGGSGKVYMVREGLFKDVDAVIHWHPGDRNQVTMRSALANKSAKFRFYGLSAHASASPEKGRSALDAVEAMNHMVNMMREHVPQETRIHYVITRGGEAPNVIPDYAEVYYYVRHPKREHAVAIFDRLINAARGAATGTETTMEYEIIGGTHDLLINKTLAEVMQKNLEKVGGVQLNKEEEAFAATIQSTFKEVPPPVTNAEVVLPLETTEVPGAASTDVGDVSYVVPTVGLRSATWAPGTPAHSWQAVACGGTSMGTKGMIVAAKTMAFTGIDLLQNPTLITEAKQELVKRIGDYKYDALLGNRKPALNYRD
jgi:aminobenzoyl-glutamate utilization protein B